MKPVILFILSILQSQIALAISVEEAYQAIPHRQQTYKSTGSETSKNLEKFFALSDQALVLRIETFKKSLSGNFSDSDTFETKVNHVTNQIAALELSSDLTDTLIKAITEQKKFFLAWFEANRNKQEFKFPGGQGTGVNSHVSAASSSLRQLYSMLMQRFSNDTATNKDAFYQHLCALDFM